ncbi:MAG: DUF3016 domain-containing protein [Pseudomonadota bacterium]
MKTLFLLLCSCPGLAALTALQAAPAAKADARTEVIFFEPEKFTDVKDGFLETARGRDAILSQIRDHLVSQAAWYVPEGLKLTVTITDVDLAGDFEPGRNPRMDDVRIVRDIYPPRISLAFKLTDADGNDVKHGTRDLTDLMFMSKLAMNPNDPLRYEKILLDDWLRADFTRVK